MTRFLIVVAATCTVAGASHAKSQEPAARTGHLVKGSIVSQALAANTLGMPDTGRFVVYLPPSYDSSPSQRFSVLYLLHGIGGSSDDWTAHATTIQKVMDDGIASGRIKEFLVVMPTAMTPFGGSFYVNSPVNGRWEDYITGELTAYVDRNFRTIPERTSRGIAGHSMGGYGALRIAMDHPELFADAIALSPCCLDVTKDLGPDNPVWAAMPRFPDVPALIAQIKRGDVYPMSVVALAAAWSPNTTQQPFPVDLPFRPAAGGVEAADDILAKWRANTIIGRVADRVDALRQLRTLFIDYGFADRFAHIPGGAEALHRELVKYRVPHITEPYEGTHDNQLWPRLLARVLPLFASGPAR